MQRKSNKVLVIDIGNQVVDSKLSDRNLLNYISHTLLPLYELVKQCEANGVKCITPDVFLKDPSSFKEKCVLLISHLTNERTNQIIKAGGKPFLLFCQESPMIATRFYINFHQLSQPFTYTMAFAGMKRRAHNNTIFIPMHFPIYFETTTTPSLPFTEKKLLVLIAANKSAPFWKAMLMKLLYGAKVRLIYPIRKNLISNLTTKKVIDLYGKGWNTDKSEAIRAAYKGLVPADSKLDTLSKYKFTLCFENAIFPGYITEKIFDALLAGSVPVYLGDPNILESIPNNTFIDAREFADTDSLHHYLDSMSEETYKQYCAYGKEFLTSSAFKKLVIRPLLKRY